MFMNINENLNTPPELPVDSDIVTYDTLKTKWNEMNPELKIFSENENENYFEEHMAKNEYSAYTRYIKDLGAAEEDGIDTENILGYGIPWEILRDFNIPINTISPFTRKLDSNINQILVDKQLPTYSDINITDYGEPFSPGNFITISMQYDGGFIADGNNAASSLRKFTGEDFAITMIYMGEYALTVPGESIREKVINYSNFFNGDEPVPLFKGSIVKFRFEPRTYIISQDGEAGSNSVDCNWQVDISQYDDNKNLKSVRMQFLKKDVGVDIINNIGIEADGDIYSYDSEHNELSASLISDSGGSFNIYIRTINPLNEPPITGETQQPTHDPNTANNGGEPVAQATSIPGKTFHVVTKNSDYSSELSTDAQLVINLDFYYDESIILTLYNAENNLKDILPGKSNVRTYENITPLANGVKINLSRHYEATSDDFIIESILLNDINVLESIENRELLPVIENSNYLTITYSYKKGTRPQEPEVTYNTLNLVFKNSEESNQTIPDNIGLGVELLGYTNDGNVIPILSNDYGNNISGLDKGEVATIKVDNLLNTVTGISYSTYTNNFPSEMIIESVEVDGIIYNSGNTISITENSNMIFTLKYYKEPEIPTSIDATIKNSKNSTSAPPAGSKLGLKLTNTTASSDFIEWRTVELDGLAPDDELPLDGYNNADVKGKQYYISLTKEGFIADMGIETITVNNTSVRENGIVTLNEGMPNKIIVSFYYKVDSIGGDESGTVAPTDPEQTPEPTPQSTPEP